MGADKIKNMGTEWGSNLPRATQQCHGTALELERTLGPKHAVLSPTTLLLRIPGFLGFLCH